MTMSAAQVLGLIYGVSELGLAWNKRAVAGATQALDRGSLRLLWVVIVVSVTLAFNLAYQLPQAGMNAAPVLRILGIALFVAGLVIRWYAIVSLGRFFTVNVAIATDHQLIDTGPYRLVRHPSYTGALMAFLGLGLCLGNWASLAVIVIPIFVVFLRRMQVEEAALLQTFGDQYGDYMRRTKRLIPAIY